MSPRFKPRLLAAVSAVVLSSGLCRAANFALGVLSFQQGNALSTWKNPLAATGAPDGVTGENPAASNYYGFPNILSPFSGAYQGDEIVQIGEGGHLTLALSRYAIPGPGSEIGVISNAGLIDEAWPLAVNSTPALTFGGGSAVVKVSADAVNWVSLGNVVFDRPTLFYANAGAYDAAAPAAPELADFGLPFDKPLSAFDGTNWDQLLDNFKVGSSHSGGGTWMDLSATGLARIGYVQFSIPDDGDPLTTHRLAIDSLAIASAASGAVPAPLAPGDADLNGAVDGDDYFRIDAGYISGGSLAGFAHGDFNWDGRIDIDDYFVIDQAWSRGGVPGPAPVPEPAALVLLLPAALLLRRRNV